ncbi:MAG: hypothetical protein Q9163_005081, partial [Psora crenata]
MRPSVGQDRVSHGYLNDSVNHDSLQNAQLDLDQSYTPMKVTEFEPNASMAPRKKPEFLVPALALEPPETRLRQKNPSSVSLSHTLFLELDQVGGRGGSKGAADL